MIKVNDEIWKDIKGYEGLYQVSNYGNVKSLEKINCTNKKYLSLCYLRKERILKPIKNYRGALRVILAINGKKSAFYIHRLVANAFIPNPDNLPQVNHKDENVKNNKVDNLEWCTAQYNSNYGNRNNKILKHIKKPILQYNLDGKFIKEYESITQASKETKIPISSISANCCKQRDKTNGYVFKFKFLGDDK